VKRKPTKGKGFWRSHSLTIVTAALLSIWLVAYSLCDPHHHLGAFFGNAIADWSGSLIIIIGTKYFIEVGSSESRPEKKPKRNSWVELLWKHSLLIFLFVTGIGWLIFYSQVDPTTKWGQVVGNIISEWVQMVGLVFLTKELMERGSKE
jgi:hypothetical protein